MPTQNETPCKFLLKLNDIRVLVIVLCQLHVGNAHNSLYAPGILYIPIISSILLNKFIFIIMVALVAIMYILKTVRFLFIFSRKIRLYFGCCISYVSNGNIIIEN